MKRARCKTILSWICLLMGGYFVLAPLATTGYAAEKMMVVPANIEPAQQVALSFGNSMDPVAVVTSASEILGFNPKIDTFTLISQDASKAIVQVTHNGINFNVTLEASGGSWTISAMNSRI